MDQAIKLNPRDRRKLAISEVVLIIAAAIGLGVVVWLAWFRPSPSPHTVDSFATCVQAGNLVREGYPEVCVTPEGAQFANPADTQQVTDSPPADDTPSLPSSAGKYLDITEWGVRVPLAEGLTDLAYTYVKNAEMEYASFTFKRLAEAGLCTTDVGVSMTRSTTKNEPPHDLSNPEPMAHVGNYYYYLAYGGAPCYDPENSAHVQLVTTINDGKLTEAVRKMLSGLQGA